MGERLLTGTKSIKTNMVLGKVKRKPYKAKRKNLIALVLLRYLFCFPCLITAGELEKK